MGRDNSCAVVGAASSEPVFGNLARDYGVSTQAGNHNAIQRRHLNAAEMARETGHRVTVAVPTNRDSYASPDEQGELLRARGQRFVRSLLASGGCPLRDASPPSSGSTLERSQEFAEAPREERE